MENSKFISITIPNEKLLELGIELAEGRGIKDPRIIIALNEHFNHEMSFAVWDFGKNDEISSVNAISIYCNACENKLIVVIHPEGTEIDLRRMT